MKITEGRVFALTQPNQVQSPESHQVPRVCQNSFLSATWWPQNNNQKALVLISAQAFEGPQNADLSREDEAVYIYPQIPGLPLGVPLCLPTQALVPSILSEWSPCPSWLPIWYRTLAVNWQHQNSGFWLSTEGVFLASQEVFSFSVFLSQHSHHLQLHDYTFVNTCLLSVCLCGLPAFCSHVYQGSAMRKELAQPMNFLH